MELPDPAPVLELILAFRRSKTMFSAVAIGVFDRLAGGAADAATLAREMGANLDSLERLLDACAGMGLLKKQGSSYSNLPVAETYLLRSSPHTLAGYILYSNRELYRLWGNLEDALREGTNRWEQTFGGEASVWRQYYRTDEAKRDFLAGMNGYGCLSSPQVAAAFDLSRFRRFVDLGGGTGHLALAACDRYPQLAAAIFDLPPVLPVTREYVLGSPYRDRVEIISGDFFSDPLPEADLFALGRILHDWPEGRIRALLAKVWARLPAEGALLIAEKLLFDDKTGPLLAIMQSLSMLVCTEGKERTLDEYTVLLREAGFAEVHGRVLDGPLDAILAVKR
jgi:acetylserotonin N-methyltransferase